MPGWRLALTGSVKFLLSFSEGVSAQISRCSMSSTARRMLLRRLRPKVMRPTDRPVFPFVFMSLWATG
jgi:hypothetical protein